METMEHEIENVEIQTNAEIKTLPLQSPSEWSYDALTRSLNLKDNTYTLNDTTPEDDEDLNHNIDAKPTNSFYKNAYHDSTNSIISLLNEMEFSPLPSPNELNEHSPSIESLPSDIDISHHNHEDKPHAQRKQHPKNTDPTNHTQMMAGLVLLCISGILDAGTIAYVNWLYTIGFTMPEIVMFQGLVQVILCFAFGIITSKQLIQSTIPPTHSANPMNPCLPPNVSFRSFVLPFSMEYNAKYIGLNGSIVQHYNSNYGAINAPDDASNSNYSIASITIHINRLSWKQVVIAMFVFGVVATASHLTYFIGYLGGLGLGLTLARDHYEIAPLFNSLAIGLAFVWSYMVYATRVTPETVLYLFLMYVGTMVCGYSFMVSESEAVDLILNVNNIYLILSAVLDSISYILIKYASSIPTFVLVFSQSVFCGISGFILFQTSPDEVASMLNQMSFSNVIEISSVGLIGFGSIWCFIRGTQLISIGTASFIHMTCFVIFSIVIQVFSIDGKIPHFYCIFGLCLILLSIVLMLIEKFNKGPSP